MEGMWREVTVCALFSAGTVQVYNISMYTVHVHSNFQTSISLQVGTILL